MTAREPRNEYQDFILQSTGRDLPLFGHALFRNLPTTFSPVDNVPVTQEYVIGPGDELLIRVWGQVDADISTVVDRNGTVTIPKVGVVTVAGIKYQDLTSYLKSIFARNFRNFELNATLGQLRSIQVYVVGQARRPGSFTVSSLSTLVNAVFAAGGPSTRGSMRGIQLKRGNRVVTELDLYDLLIAGDKSRDAQLLPGDVIYFPAVGPLAAVSGSVNNPGIYELKGTTPLSDLIRWAGGLATTAQGQRVVVERIENRTFRKVEQMNLDNAGLKRSVQDGDLVTVFSVLPRFEDAVTLRGNVAQPGRFPWRSGLRIRDLIPDRESVVSRDYWIRRNQEVGLDPAIARLLNQQELLGTQLGVQDLSGRRLVDEEDVTIAEAVRRRQIEADAEKFLSLNRDSGRSARPAASSTNSQTQLPVTGQDPTRGVQNPIQSNPSQGLPRPSALRREIWDPTRLVNQIRPPLKEVNWDYALIERISPEDLTTKLIPFNLGKAILDNDPQHNLLLRPNDVITIFSKEDIQVSASRQTKYIRLEGEFNSPGVYQIQPGETLRQLAIRVGGLARGAYLFGADFTRESTRAQQEKNLEDALNRLERDIQRFNITRAQSVAAEDAGSVVQNAASQAQLIAQLRQLRPTGRIVLEVPPDGTVKDLPDLPLEDGDRFYVPTVPSMVNVVGAVFSENSFVYRPEKRTSDYLNLAGGPTKSADKGSTYVLRADGSVVSALQSSFLLSSSLDGMRIMPGDNIVVPEELDRTSIWRRLRDLSQILYQFGLGAAALKVLKN